MLIQRVISAALGIIYIFYALYRRLVFKVSVLIMALILMHEFYHAFIKRMQTLNLVRLYIYILILFCFLSY